MVANLLIYLIAAIGEAVCVAFAINVVHGRAWKVRWHEKATMAFMAVCGLGSLELARRYLLTPFGDWPVLLKSLATFCSFVALVVLPAVTFARSRRRTPEGVVRDDHRSVLDGKNREAFIGQGTFSWMLRLPGNESLDLTVHEWSLRIPQLPPELDELSILHLTDLHFSHAYDRRYFEAVFDAAASAPADLVFITGDLVDEPECIDWITPLLARLSGPLGRFAILGNHDHFHDLERIARATTAAGYTVLDGDVATIDVHGRRLAIGGTCAPWGPAIAAGSIPEADFSMLLSHTPDLAYKAAAQGWDFMLCGHNHGGQIRLPVIGPVLMPSRYSRRFDRGFFRIDPTLMYVSQGVGAKHPIRYGCPPEISRFTLVRHDVAAPRDQSAGAARQPVEA
ncbi:MAG: metallophosphoesterase [Paludisphaera borealis]|uniref:metallophosphoesterase n=1 Tax=Paludisphaera borealis TaxID=1387353 RepID=UPI00284206EA|nr:metallophosphoesterase [Paludisphaera borealis]MDR3622396.1 metallophosphoesterase [Paludisphaera borealis]